MSPSAAEAKDLLTAVGSVLKILLLFLAVIIIVRSWPDIRRMGIKKVKLPGFEIEFDDLKDAFQKQVEEANKIRTNNPRTKDAGIGISNEEMNGAIERALRINRVFLGADILWIYESPLHDFYFRKLLRYLGAGVESARSTQEAIELIAMNKFDLLISDINRPDDNGIQGLYHLREKWRYKGLAIFFVYDVDYSLPLPVGSLGITNRPDCLLHLIADGLERTRWDRIPVQQQDAAVGSKDT